MVLIWGANFSVVKYALAEIRPLPFNALRFVLASAILWLLLRFRRKITFERRHLWPLIGLGVGGNVLYQVLFIFGLDWTLAGNAALMLATVPVFVMLFSVALGHERASLLGWSGVVLSFTGIALVVWGGARNLGFGATTVRGDLAMLGAAVLWSAYTVGSRPLVRRYGTLPVTAFTMWVGTVGLVLLAVPGLLSQDWGAVSAGGWSALAYSGALAIAAAYVLWYYSVGAIGSSRTAIYSNTIPIVALVVAWLTLGEVPTWLQLAGAVAILAGIGLARLARLDVEARPTPAPE